MERTIVAFIVLLPCVTRTCSAFVSLLSYCFSVSSYVIFWADHPGVCQLSVRAKKHVRNLAQCHLNWNTRKCSQFPYRCGVGFLLAHVSIGHEQISSLK